MIKIRSVILDFGGVISRPKNKNFGDTINRILIKKPPNFMDVYRSYRTNYDNGQKTGEEYWSHILSHYGYPINKPKIEALIVEDIKSWTEINPNMIQFISDVRKRVHNLSIISNMPEDILDYIRNNFQWLDHFDELTWSCEVGVVKPDPGIYEYCLDKIGIPAHECLFVDDSKANVDAAKRCGLNAIHFKSYSQFAEKLDGNYHLSNV
jgi:putative hydrolase of the HAD superfamily